MKKILDYICVIMFFTIIIMFAVSTLFFNSGAGAVSDSASSPAQAVDSFLLDSFPLQESFHGLRTSLMLAAGRTEIDDCFLVDGAVIRPTEQISEDATERIKRNINSFSKKYEGVSAFVALIPSASGIYSADIPSVGLGFDQKRYIEDLYFSLDSSVVTLDAYSPLYSSRDNYIYMRTDNCLTSKGAFGVYYSVMRKMGVQPHPLSDYDTEHALTNFYGSLSDELNITAQISPDSIELLIPKNGTVVKSVTASGVNGSDEYKSVFDRNALLGQTPLDVFVYGSRYEKLDIKTINASSPRLLIIKSRSADPVIPFIVSHYSRVTVIDAQKALYDISRYTDPAEYDQVLFILDIESLEEASIGLERLMNGQAAM